MDKKRPARKLSKAEAARAKRLASGAKPAAKKIPAKKAAAPNKPKKEEKPVEEKEKKGGLFGFFKKKEQPVKEEPVKEELPIEEEVTESISETVQDEVAEVPVEETEETQIEDPVEVEEKVEAAEVEAPVQEEEPIVEDIKEEVIADAAPTPEALADEEGAEVVEEQDAESEQFEVEEPTSTTGEETVDEPITEKVAEETIAESIKDDTFEDADQSDNEQEEQPINEATMSTNNGGDDIDNTPINSDKEEKPKRSALMLLLFLGALAGMCVFAWMWLQEKNKVAVKTEENKTVTSERDNVIADLESLKEDYKILETADEALKGELEQRRLEIDSLLKEAKKYKNDRYTIYKLRKQAKSLRKIMRHYVHEIDSLNTLNQTIRAEKAVVEKNLSSEKERASQLEVDKEMLQDKVTKASVLTAKSPTAVGIRVKGGKQKATSKASKVEKIKVSFVLGANPVARNEVKPVFIHIMGPDGKEVAQSASAENSVRFGESKGLFAAKKDVKYSNKDVSVNILCPNNAGWMEGQYLIDVICDNEIVGQTSITLK